MASTKPAGTFDGWRVTIGVGSANFPPIYRRHKQLGFQPKPCGAKENDPTVNGVALLFQEIVPQSSIRGTPEGEFFKEEVEPFGAYIAGCVNVTGLICPPASETKPCRIGEKLGICPTCEKSYEVIGPIPSSESGKELFVMVRHMYPVGSTQICYGSGLSPKDGWTSDNVDYEPAAGRRHTRTCWAAREP
jgi:hypothetical protein